MKCKICSSENITILTKQLRRGEGVVLYCNDCQTGMLEKTIKELDIYYQEKYRKNHGPTVNKSVSYADIFDSYVGYQTERVELFKPYLREDKKLLEVGCSTGHFIYNIRNLVGEIIGVDYDAGAAKFAGEICKCKTFGCGLEDAGLKEKYFDIVCAMHTMEHVEDPIEFASMLGKYLRPGGTIFIEVPNMQDPLLSVYENENYRKFWFHDAHLFYFTPQSLKAVMEKANFTGNIHYAQDYNFLNHMSWNLLGKPQPTCHEGLGPARLPIANQVIPEVAEELQIWMDSVDRQYKAILAKHGLTSNMTFIGQLRGEEVVQ